MFVLPRLKVSLTCKSSIRHGDRGNSFGEKKVKKDENEEGGKNTEIEIDEAGDIKISVKKC